MENNLEYHQEKLKISDKELFIKIWTSPRQIFRYIDDHKFDKYVKILLALAGISETFAKASSKHLGDELPLWAILGFCIILGGLLGWFSFYIYAALISWTGRWLKGQGDTSSILRIISYSMIPSIVGLLFLLPQLGIFGIELFKKDGILFGEDLLSEIFGFGSMVLEYILDVWSLILCVIGLSEVQKFSTWKSIFNLLLPAIVFLVPLLILVLLL
jgi:hypothetical protein